MKKINQIVLWGLVCLAGSLFLSCNTEDTETWMDTSINYMLTISPDLLKFVSPEVTYVDSEGVVHKISGVKDLDSLVNVNYASVPGNTIITLQVIEGTNYKTWSLNMRFNKRPFHSYFGVKYKKLDTLEDITDKVYDFHHSVFSTTILAKSSIKSEIKWYSTTPNYSFGSSGLVTNFLSFTKDSHFKGEEVQGYIDDLVKTPDKSGFLIDEEGKFIVNKNFSLD